MPRTKKVEIFLGGTSTFAACYAALVLPGLYNRRLCQVLNLTGLSVTMVRTLENLCYSAKEVLNLEEAASSVRQNLRINRRSANISLLNPWHFSTWFIHKWVLCYPDAFGVGITRASPVTKKPERVPSRLSLQVGFLSLC